MSVRPPVVIKGTFHATIQSPGAAAGGAGTAYDAVVLADGPAGYWPLSDAAGTVAADKAGAHPGAYQGGYTLGATGIGDGAKAVTLDGATASQVSIAGIPAGAVVPPVTLELWVNPTAGNTYYALLTRTTGGSGTPYDWYLHGPGPTGGYSSLTAPTASPPSARSPSAPGITSPSPTTPPATPTPSSSTSTAPPAAHSPMARSPTPARRLLVGNRGDGVTAFKGSLAKAAWYSKVLSPARIAAHYAAG